LHILRPFSPLVNRLVKLYTRHDRKFSFKDINVKVKRGVFHPGLFMSTKIMLNYVEGLNLKQKTFLELGSGTGVISILAAKKDALVYASDISTTAVENTRFNASENEVEIDVIKSDLFEKIPNVQFDYIIINPPYYTKDPETDEQFAWYCGKNHEYFKKLFESLPEFINQDSKVFMILSEVCDINTIKSIGEENGFRWNSIQSKTAWGEKNYIFRLTM